MTIVKINIDNKEFEVECKDGEEKLLIDAEKKIISIINDFPEIRKLSESKKFLMISLILAEEGIRKNKENMDFDNHLDSINVELEKLEDLIDAKK